MDDSKIPINVREGDVDGLNLLKEGFAERPSEDSAKVDVEELRVGMQTVWIGLQVAILDQKSLHVVCDLWHDVFFQGQSLL